MPDLTVAGAAARAAASAAAACIYYVLGGDCMYATVGCHGCKIDSKSVRETKVGANKPLRARKCASEVDRKFAREVDQKSPKATLKAAWAKRKLTKNQ